MASYSEINREQMDYVMFALGLTYVVESGDGLVYYQDPQGSPYPVQVDFSRGSAPISDIEKAIERAGVNFTQFCYHLERFLG